MESSQPIRQKALDLLSRREYSARELQVKLSPGHDQHVVEALIEDLQQQGLQSDARFAEVWTRQRYLQGYGPVRVQVELRQKGISSELVQQSLGNEDMDWFANAREAYLRRFGHRPPKDHKDKAKQMRFLQYRGFTGDQIRFAMDSAD